MLARGDLPPPKIGGEIRIESLDQITGSDYWWSFKWLLGCVTRNNICKPTLGFDQRLQHEMETRGLAGQCLSGVKGGHKSVNFTITSMYSYTYSKWCLSHAVKVLNINTDALAFNCIASTQSWTVAAQKAVHPIKVNVSMLYSSINIEWLVNAGLKWCKASTNGLCIVALKFQGEWRKETLENGRGEIQYVSLLAEK